MFNQRLSFIVAAGMLLCGAGARAQVTYLGKAPTVQELKAAFAASRSAPAAPGLASRGIEFTAPGGAAPNSAAAIAKQAVAAPADAAAATAAAPSGAAVAMPINFELNSSRLGASSTAYLSAVAGLLAQDASLKLTIEGHTDADGPPTRNIMLSWDRAMSVFRTLVDKYGVDPQRLQPLGRGALEPLDGMTPTSPMNRRVQFRVVG